MDPFTLSIGVAAVVILFTIVYLVSAFASKEKTYEQAVAEHQKLKQPAPTANKDNNKDKKIKDKKDKNKKDKKNKDKGGKSAEVIDERSTEALFKPIVDESKTKEESKIEAKPESVLVSKKDKFASKSSSNKTTGVAASTEPEVFKGISASKKNSDKITKTESNTIILESVPKADKQKQEKSKSKENVDKIGKPIEKREKRTPLTPKGDDSANNSGFFSLGKL